MAEPMWRRYARLLGPDPKSDAADEITFHIDMRVREYMAQGMDEPSARAAALKRFGEVVEIRQELERLGVSAQRRERRRSWMAELAQDARYAGRMIARAPALSVVAVLTLALGVGATSSIFTVVDGVLLRPLPYPAPERLVRVWETSPQGDATNVVSSGNVVDWSTRATSFVELGAHRWPYAVTMTGPVEPVRVLRGDLTPSALRALGASPLLGRVFTDEDARAGGRVALLSYRLWRDGFGSDPGVLGRMVRLNEVAYTVIGVMRPEFAFPSAQPELWRPITPDELDPDERRSHNFLVVGRLEQGVTVTQAQAEMDALAVALAEEHPQFMSGWGANVVPMHADLVASVRPVLIVLLAGVSLVLLIACTNIANLLLARAVTREREIAVRGALGAGRGRLARQLLTESAVLGVAGGALGLLVGALMLQGLLALAPDDIPRLDQVGLDRRAVAFTAGITMLSALLFGLVPAFRLARTDLQSTLRGASDPAGGVRHARLRAALLVAEVAVALVLMAGAGLLVRSSVRLTQVDYGFRDDGLLAVSLDLPRARYEATPAHIEFYQRLTERVAQLPGVVGAGGTTEPPASGFNMTFSFQIEGREAANPSGREDPQPLRIVTTDYFRTMGVPLLQGRLFDDRDRPGAPPIIIINRALARLHWPDRSPVGERISFARPGAQEWLEIVGVVGDTRMVAADEPPQPALYMPHAQKLWDWASWLTLMVRTEAGRDPSALAPAIRAALRQQDAELAITELATVEDLYRASTARNRFATVLLSAFAIAALLLGSIGMYGVLSYAVAQRRRELGIRVALGADRGRLLADVVRRALALTALGIAIGAAAALALGRALSALLYEISPHDPLTLGAVAALLLIVAAAAALLPARRATRVDPMLVMRHG
ncbi:MAG: ADOP family duplicated permease [Longimicrobiales bacterium]